MLFFYFKPISTDFYPIPLFFKTWYPHRSEYEKISRRKQAGNWSSSNTNTNPKNSQPKGVISSFQDPARIRRILFLQHKCFPSPFRRKINSAVFRATPPEPAGVTKNSRYFSRPKMPPETGALFWPPKNHQYFLSFGRNHARMPGKTGPKTKPTRDPAPCPQIAINKNARKGNTCYGKVAPLRGSNATAPSCILGRSAIKIPVDKKYQNPWARFGLPPGF